MSSGWKADLKKGNAEILHSYKWKINLFYWENIWIEFDKYLGVHIEIIKRQHKDLKIW